MSLCLKVCEPEQKSTSRAPEVSEPLDLALIQIKHFEDYTNTFLGGGHQKPPLIFNISNV